MSPTYLVLLAAGGAAIVVGTFTDEREAVAAYNGAIAEHRGRIQNFTTDKPTVYLTTVRAEAKLS